MHDGRSTPRQCPNDAACSSRVPSRAELQASRASSRALAAQYGLNPKTVAKWRGRTVTSDAPLGPKKPSSTVLPPAEEATVVEFRRRTLLPLDDVLGCLRDTIPNLSRSAPHRCLHRCLQRHGTSRLPAAETAQTRKRFETREIGYVPIDSCELRHADGTLVMFLALPAAAPPLEGCAYEVEVRLELPHLEDMTGGRRVCLCLASEANGNIHGIAVPSDNNPLARCPVSNVRRAGDELTFDIACEGRNAAQASARHLLGATAFRGRITMRMGGKNMTMTEVQTGRRIGACDAHPPAAR